MFGEYMIFQYHEKLKVFGYRLKHTERPLEDPFYLKHFSTQATFVYCERILPIRKEGTLETSGLDLIHNPRLIRCNG